MSQCESAMVIDARHIARNFWSNLYSFSNKSGLTLVVAAKRLFLPKGTLKNWIYADKQGELATCRQTYPVTLMCRVLNVSESGFYAWRIRPPCERERENTRLETEILAAHQRTRETYSAKRLHSDLEDHGVQTTPYLVRTLRKKMGLRCKQRRKFW